jgi:hypothetical protein
VRSSRREISSLQPQSPEFWPLIRGGPIRWWAFGVAAVFVVLALLSTAALALIVTAFLFYVTVTAIPLLMRILGKDPHDCTRLCRGRHSRVAGTRVETIRAWVESSPPETPSRPV